METFGWQINNKSIESWYIPTTSSSVQVTEERDHFEIKLYLDITNGEPPTVSSRLVGSIDQGLYNGDEISCVDSTATVRVSQSLNLSYSLVTGKLLISFQLFGTAVMIYSAMSFTIILSIFT